MHEALVVRLKARPHMLNSIEGLNDKERAILIEALAAPPQPASDDVDIIVRAKQTQCCDPIIDGVLGSLIKECEDLRSRQAAEASVAESRPQWRHIKRGSIVTEVGRGLAQVSVHPIEEMSAVVIYEHDGALWVRNAVEFDDGRFEKIAAAPSEVSVAEFHRETLQMVLDLLNPLHGSLDLQVTEQFTDERELDPPSDREYAVNVTWQMERDLTQAVTILENRIRYESPPAAAHPPPWP
jgi:hypothetical protein